MTAPNLVADVRRLAKNAAAAGAALAVLCHFLPPHYRAICDTVAALCKGSTP